MIGEEQTTTDLTISLGKYCDEEERERKGKR
jgi:hypothetical protein